MIKMTSAYANKILKKLYDDKNYLLTQESSSFVYVASVDEEPVIPEYDYPSVQAQITDIDEKIVRIKHAINVSNATNIITVGEESMTVDMILVKMAQLNSRKNMLDRMRKQQPKSRVDSYSYSNKKVSPEYQYINYDMEQVKKDYEAMDKLIAEMQIALDRYNQTLEFEVDM